MVVGQSNDAIRSKYNKENSNLDLLVIANLINLAGHEYDEAMSDGKIDNLLQYQDGQIFVKQVLALFQSLDHQRQNQHIKVIK